jgi:hypothetical protein
MRLLEGIGVLLVLAFVGCVGALLAGCHQLYPEDVTSLHAADQQLLAAYQATDPVLVQAHIRAAFCNEEAVERRHAGTGQLDTHVIVCIPPRK